MKIIQKRAPLLFNILKSGDEEFMYENMNKLKDMFYMGFTPEIVGELAKELASLHDY